MKKILGVAVLIFMQLTLLAQSEKSVELPIKDVTVYRQGVQVSRIGRCVLSKGKTTLEFKALSSKIDPKSIQAKASAGVTIVSVSHSLDFLNKNKASKEIEKLDQDRRNIEDSLKLLGRIKEVFKSEREMVLSNKSIGGNNGVNVAELQNAASFFRNRLTEIETKLSQIERRTFRLRADLLDINNQLNELNAQIDQPSSLIKVVVTSDKQMESTFNLTYIIAEAGWNPAYDVRIKDVDSPLNLTYKAKVFQNTGEDWKDVRMTLSTGNPSITNSKPDLDAYYLTFNNYYRNVPKVAIRGINSIAGAVSGIVTDAESGDVIPGVTIRVKGTSIGASSDINGKYSIKIPNGRGVLTYSFVGYEMQEQSVIAGSVVNTGLKPITYKIEEVIVVAKGINIDAEESSSYTGASSEVKKEEQVPLAIQKRQTTTEFKIEIPYTIPSDDQQYDVAMVDYEIPALYGYGAVPKLSDDAYLMASITDWTKYNLLSGNANLFFKGVYQGETHLDLTSTDDTLRLSVGRDKDILIQRDVQKDFTSRSFAGSSNKDLKAWNLTVKNNKETSVNIIVEDQYPVSKSDDIKVELQEATGAKVDESTGKLTWSLHLGPKEKKVLLLKYLVKYPKGKKVIVE